MWITLSRLLDFPLRASKCFIILPAKNAADGTKPWVWYALGAHPDAESIPTLLRALGWDFVTWIWVVLLLFVTGERAALKQDSAQ